MGVGAFAIALKFPTYWNQWVYFPAVPNVLDSLWLVTTGAFLITLAASEARGEKWRIWPMRADRDGVQPWVSVLLMIGITVLLAILLFLLIESSV